MTETEWIACEDPEKMLEFLQWAGGEIALKAARAVGSVVEYLVQADLVRDIFGNPFNSVSLDQNWLTSNNGAAPTLAKTIYDDRTFERLPEPAGVLEMAGCRDISMLEHCRHLGPHVRGCWVVDAILNKS